MAQRNNISIESLDEFGDLKDSNSEVSIDDAKSKRKDSKRLFTKKEPKDKGYSTLSAEYSQESIFLMANKSSKKSKQDGKIGLFKTKSAKEEKKEKIKETANNNNEMAKRVKSEKRKKVKDGEAPVEELNKVLFEDTLENTVAAFPCHDGINIPYPIRICFEIIEEKGLECEGIYRRIRNKSQIDSIFEAINKNFESKLTEISSDPLIAASIIKKFFRDLKVPLINDDLINLFEKCEQISDKEVELKIEAIRKTFKKMPVANRDTFSVLIVHLSKMMQKSEINKMDSQNIVLTFQSIVRIKDRLFKFILRHYNLILKDFRYKKYRLKGSDESTFQRKSIIPDNIQDLENEISNQEKILYDLHAKIAKSEKDKKLQEQFLEELWAIQTYVTSLKRKVKKLKNDQKPSIDLQVHVNPSVKSGIEDKKNQSEVNEETSGKNLDEEEKSKQEELIKIISENETLVETLQILFEKLSKEKVKIFDLQQQQQTALAYQIPNQLIETINYDTINLNELQRNHEKLLSENKQIEDKIGSINEKINLEKQKIFELKSNIKYHDFKNIPVNQAPQIINHTNSKNVPLTVRTLTSPNQGGTINIIDNGLSTKL